MFIEDWIQVVIIWACRKIHWSYHLNVQKNLKFGGRLSIHFTCYVFPNTSHQLPVPPRPAPIFARQLLQINIKWSLRFLTNIFSFLLLRFPNYYFSFTHAFPINLFHMIMFKSKWAQKLLHNDCCRGPITMTLRHSNNVWLFSYLRIKKLMHTMIINEGEVKQRHTKVVGKQGKCTGK